MIAIASRLERVEMPTRNELETGALGGLIGGIAAGVVLQVSSITIQQIAGVVGFEQTLGNGWGTFLIFGVLCGVAYAGVVTQLVDRYVAFVVSLTSQSDLIRSAVMPLTNRFGMRVVVTSAMGLIYGMVLGILVVVFLIPLRLGYVSFPHLDVVSILGFMLFGLVLGITYGTKVAS